MIHTYSVKVFLLIPIHGATGDSAKILKSTPYARTRRGALHVFGLRYESSMISYRFSIFIIDDRAAKIMVGCSAESQYLQRSLWKGLATQGHVYRNLHHIPRRPGHR